MSGVGYHPCACRDCFEVYVGEPGEFCDECEVAGCCPDEECQAPGAYGADEIPDERDADDWANHKE